MCTASTMEIELLMQAGLRGDELEPTVQLPDTSTGELMRQAPSIKTPESSRAGLLSGVDEPRRKKSKAERAGPACAGLRDNSMGPR